MEQLQRGKAPSPVKPQLKAEPSPSKSDQILSRMSEDESVARTLQFDSHLFSATVFSFSARFKKGKRIFFFFLTSHLPFAWLHKRVSVFPSMTSSITDKHLLIYQFCRQPSKWAERLLTPLRLQLILSSNTNECTRVFGACRSVIAVCTRQLFYFLATLALGPGMSVNDICQISQQLWNVKIHFYDFVIPWHIILICPILWL